MRKSAKSLLAFGVYLVFLGLILLIVPNALLTVFFLPSTEEVWVRVVGMLLLFLAFYCWHEPPFFRNENHWVWILVILVGLFYVPIRTALFVVKWELNHTYNELRREQDGSPVDRNQDPSP